MEIITDIAILCQFLKTGSSSNKAIGTKSRSEMETTRNLIDSKPNPHPTQKTSLTRD
jgi:hypothetical protein